MGKVRTQSYSYLKHTEKKKQTIDTSLCTIQTRVHRFMVKGSTPGRRGGPPLPSLMRVECCGFDFCILLFIDIVFSTCSLLAVARPPLETAHTPVPFVLPLDDYGAGADC